MEDAATAEIARVQLWQWVKYASKTVSLQLSAWPAPANQVGLRKVNHTCIPTAYLPGGVGQGRIYRWN
jgi:hypothetical protein